MLQSKLLQKMNQAILYLPGTSSHKSFMLYVHHTDSVREWAYDRDSHIGKLDKGLDLAKKNGWTIADMARDWKLIYPFEIIKSDLE
jgi:hypothetical protein